MTKRTLSALFSIAIVSLTLTAATEAQQLPGAVTSDPPRDNDSPAAMEAPDITSHGARLNAVFYLASGAGPHPVVLLLHGFPGNEQNMGSGLRHPARRLERPDSALPWLLGQRRIIFFQ